MVTRRGDRTARVSAGTVHRGNPSTYRDLLLTLRPGDTLSLETGTYTDGLRLHNVHGTLGAPVTIAGPALGPRAVFHARDGYHTISLRDSSHIDIRNLELDGRHKAVDGVKAEGEGNLGCTSVHDITLENLYIHGHDGGQQTVGINTKCTAWNWTVRQIIVEHAGTGMYFGSSDGSTPFINGLIEHNVIVDSLGYNMQIKHQGPRPNIRDIPRHESTTTIRHNVFGKANHASTGDDARPNLLVGHWPLSGMGSHDVYQIYGNFFYQNPSGESLFQGEGHIALYNNLFVNHEGDAVRIRPHNERPRTIRVFNNTVLVGRHGIRITGSHRDYTQEVIGNAIFAGSIPLRGGDQAQNVVDTYRRADRYLRNPFDGPGRLDLRPKSGRLTGSALEVTSLRQFQDWNLDFDGRFHDGTRRGAYAGGAAGWQPDLSRKPPVGANAGGR